MDKPDEIHIGTEIHKVMKQQKMSVVELATLLHLHRQSVYDMLSRDNIDVKRLAELSKILNYDFYNTLFGKCKK